LHGRFQDTNARETTVDPFRPRRPHRVVGCGVHRSRTISARTGFRRPWSARTRTRAATRKNRWRGTWH
jgi:hypothetical protein